MNFADLPIDLPVPLDDGAESHLTGLTLPPIQLHSTYGEVVELDQLKGQYVIYVYPMTGRPNFALPEGWDSIPGARGCTPQSCSFRDHAQELAKLNTQIFGLSSQTTEYQLEVKNRLHLPFELLSDSSFLLKETLRLPTFLIGPVDGHKIELYKRLTLIIKNGQIVKSFYPVFPPDKNVDDVIEWLKKIN